MSSGSPDCQQPAASASSQAPSITAAAPSPSTFQDTGRPKARTASAPCSGQAPTHWAHPMHSGERTSRLRLMAMPDGQARSQRPQRVQASSLRLTVTGPGRAKTPKSAP